MKIRLAAIGIALIAAVIFGLLGGSASANNKPIPGVDIIVVRHGNGVPGIHARSGPDGKFVFANLEAGTYELSVTMPQTKAAINTSRSNIKHLAVVENGVEVVNVSIELGKDRPAPVEIEITKNGGKIIGTVTRAENGGDVRLPSTAGAPITGGVAKPTPTPKPTGDPGNVGIGTSLAKPNPKGGDVKPGIQGEPIPRTDVGLEGDPGSVIVMANPPKNGSSVLYKGHKGIVTLVKGVATINWDGGFVTRIVGATQNGGGTSRISDQAAGGVLTSYRTGPPKKGRDGILSYELVQVPDSKSRAPK